MNVTHTSMTPSQGRSREQKRILALYATLATSKSLVDIAICRHEIWKLQTQRQQG